MGKVKLESIENGYEGYLSDESRQVGTALSISFPEDIEEIKETLGQLTSNDGFITVQGARTGITGGAVPEGGHILNMSRMDKVTGFGFDKGKNRYIIHAQPGLALSNLRKMLETKSFDTAGWSEESLRAYRGFHSGGDWFLPPDPTEASATIGGMAACNSSGSRSYFYGSVRRYIRGLDIILADGSLLSMERSCNRAQNGSFRLRTESGRELSGQIPDYQMPSVKNASGYYSDKDMDIIDLFIGSEGTLGIIAGVSLELLPKPAVIWGITTFFSSESEALRFVIRLREKAKGSQPDDQNATETAAIEFFNENTIKLIKKFEETNPDLPALPDIPGGCCAIYAELHGNDEDSIYAAAENMAVLVGECGGSEENTWLASNTGEMEKMQNLRHSAPEAVNHLIGERKKRHPEITKLGTDMAVPDEGLLESMDMYNTDLRDSGLESVIFGHIGNNHVHVNILPRTPGEYKQGIELYHKWARKVISMGGTISAEHGVGKLKTSLLNEMYGVKGIEQMLAVKRIFDPGMMLNPGNLFNKSR